MDLVLVRTIAILAFIISLAGVGAYIDTITMDKVNAHKAYTSLIVLITTGMFTIIFLILLGLCFLIKLFV